jgi:hypothetical protein
MQATILTPLPGTELYKRFKETGRLLYTNYPEDWERYNYAEVVYQPQKMTPDEFRQAVYENWKRLYDLKVLKRKFLKTLKITKNPTTAVWAFSSNLHMHNFVFEEEQNLLDIYKIFPQIFEKIE